MKALFFSVVVIFIAQVHAADVEIGKYKAIDVDTKKIQAALELRANGSVNFNVKTPDFIMPEPGCEGKYKVKGHELSADVKCPSDLLPRANVTIDITDVNAQSLRSESGVKVDVYIDALGNEAIKFLIKKAD